jgi:hypothetical protein
MHTQETEDQSQSLGQAAKQVSEHASALVRLELELAALEVKRKIVPLGLGIGLGVGALVMLLLMVGFAYATLAAVLATFLSTWLALLIVTGILLLKTLLLGLLALGRIKKGMPPVPKQAIHEAKLTTEALKSDGNA